jgi:ABC-type ATPase involved in cell division
MLQNSEFEQTNEIKAILDVLENAYDSVFITGKAGTGKSTLLRRFLSETIKNCVILAPTGIAALNAGGQKQPSFHTRRRVLFGRYRTTHFLWFFRKKRKEF